MAAIIYCVAVFSSPAEQNVYENTTPANMANPPNVGMLGACVLRSVGSSKRFLITETRIIDGIAKKVITNAIKQARVMLNIIQKLFNAKVV